MWLRLLRWRWCNICPRTIRAMDRWWESYYLWLTVEIRIFPPPPPPFLYIWPWHYFLWPWHYITRLEFCQRKKNFVSAWRGDIMKIVGCVSFICLLESPVNLVILVNPVIPRNLVIPLNPTANLIGNTNNAWGL